MSRRTLLAVVAALALPAATHARDREYEADDSDWGYIDDVPAEVQVDVNAGSSVTFETFEENLSPYGEWVSAGAYGRVWRPAHVSAGWRPYYEGSWQWTDEGWLWASSEPWGWATYHYGRWAHDPFYGWVWMPGYQWAPAWVSWRVGGGYIGWAPLGPGLSVYVTNYPVVYDHWCFVPTTRFVGVPVHNVGFVGPRVGRIWGGTQPAPPRATVAGSPAPAWGGAPRPFVERQVGRPITPVRVQPVATPQAVTAPSRAGVIPVFRPDAARPHPGTRGAVSGGTPARGGGVVSGGAPARGVAPAPAPGVAPSHPGSAAPGRAAPQGGAPAWGAPAPRGERGPAAAPATPVPSREHGGGGAPAPSRQRAEEGNRGAVAPRSPAPAPARARGEENNGGAAPAPPSQRSMAPAPVSPRSMARAQAPPSQRSMAAAPPASRSMARAQAPAASPSMARAAPGRGGHGGDRGGHGRFGAAPLR